MEKNQKQVGLSLKGPLPQDAVVLTYSTDSSGPASKQLEAEIEPIAMDL